MLYYLTKTLETKKNNFEEDNEGTNCTLYKQVCLLKVDLTESIWTVIL
jgi:hypothetical protein